MSQQVPLNPEPDQELEFPEGERLSWAAYFGAATGLALGILLVVLGAEALHGFWPETGWAEVFWEVSSPIFALLGLVLGGFGFHRFLRGRTILPGVIFVLVLAGSMALVLRPSAFAWRHAQNAEEAQPAAPAVDGGTTDALDGK